MADLAANSKKNTFDDNFQKPNDHPIVKEYCKWFIFFFFSFVFIINTNITKNLIKKKGFK